MRDTLADDPCAQCIGSGCQGMPTIQLTSEVLTMMERFRNQSSDVRSWAMVGFWVPRVAFGELGKTQDGQESVEGVFSSCKTGSTEGGNHESRG